MASLNVPMYDPAMVRPMREELTRIGFSELRTAAEVDAALADERAPMLVVVNSVCGCAARNARPAATLALEHPVRPNKLYTVFAGHGLRSVRTLHGPVSRRPTRLQAGAAQHRGPQPARYRRRPRRRVRPVLCLKSRRSA